MKSLIALCAILSSASLADTVCESVSRHRYVNGWQEAATVQRLTAPVIPGGRVDCEYYPDREEQLNLKVMRELGRLDGVEYKLHYSDGSAVIQGENGKRLEVSNYSDNWNLSCRNVESPRPLLCTVTKDDIAITRGTDGKMLLSVGSDYLEPSEILIRVSGQSALRVPAAKGFTPEQVDLIIQQMQTAKSVDSRYHQHDRQRPTDRKTSLYGLNQAVFIMERVMEQLNAGKSVEH